MENRIKELEARLARVEAHLANNRTTLGDMPREGAQVLDDPDPDGYSVDEGRDYEELFGTPDDEGSKEELEEDWDEITKPGPTS